MAQPCPKVSGRSARVASVTTADVAVPGTPTAPDADARSAIATVPSTIGPRAAIAFNLSIPTRTETDLEVRSNPPASAGPRFV